MSRGRGEERRSAGGRLRRGSVLLGNAGGQYGYRSKTRGRESASVRESKTLARAPSPGTFSTQKRSVLVPVCKVCSSTADTSLEPPRAGYEKMLKSPTMQNGVQKSLRFHSDSTDSSGFREYQFIVPCSKYSSPSSLSPPPGSTSYIRAGY